MSMDKRGDTWRFRIRKDGQTYTMNFKGTEKEAKKAHDAFKVDIERGNLGTNENMRLDELCKLVYEEYVLTNCRANTQRIYKYNYNRHILPALGTMKISSIKSLHIQKFVNTISKTLKPSTVNSCLGCLGKTFSLAEEWGIIKETPFKHIKKPKPANKNHSELLSMEQIKKLLDYYSCEDNLLHKTIFYLAIGCGLRNSEIRALTLSDIDFNNGIITVNKQMGAIRNDEGLLEEGIAPPKTSGSIRKIYVPKFILSILQDYISSLPYIPITQQIFYSHKTKKPITSKCISKRFKTTCEKLEIPPIRFHDLRHLQATLLIHSNANIQAISKRLGHSDIQTTLNVYTHSIEAIDKQIAVSLEDTFKKMV